MMCGKIITCIICPLGCAIEVTDKGDNNLIIRKYQCKRGKKYAEEEYLAPTRILATTVKIKNYIYPVISVRTRGAVPKKLIFDCMNILKTVEIEGPVSVGDVVFENILNSGIDVITTSGYNKRHINNL